MTVRNTTLSPRQAHEIASTNLAQVEAYHPTSNDDINLKLNNLDQIQRHLRRLERSLHPSA
jgi:hypothetical protein